MEYDLNLLEIAVSYYTYKQTAKHIEAMLVPGTPFTNFDWL